MQGSSNPQDRKQHASGSSGYMSNRPESRMDDHRELNDNGEQVDNVHVTFDNDKVKRAANSTLEKEEKKRNPTTPHLVPLDLRLTRKTS